MFSPVLVPEVLAELSEDRDDLRALGGEELCSSGVRGSKGGVGLRRS